MLLYKKGDGYKSSFKVFVFYYPTLLKVTLLHVCFSHILSCTNGTKSRNTSHKLFMTKYKPYQPISEKCRLKASLECIFLFFSLMIYLLMLNSL